LAVSSPSPSRRNSATPVKSHCFPRDSGGADMVALGENAAAAVDEEEA